MIADFFDYLVCIYFIFCAFFVIIGYLVEYICRQSPYLKIQSQKKRANPKLVNRDFKQSFFNLFYQAVFLALGLSFRNHGYLVSYSDMGIKTFPGICFTLSLLLYDTWFYWMHRLEHTKFLFRRIHAWHHVTKTPTVWATNSNTLLESILVDSYWMVALIVSPFPTYILLLHRGFLFVTDIIGHCGYEFTGNGTWLVSTTFHDRHHEFINCNYGNQFLFWDKLMKTNFK